MQEHKSKLKKSFLSSKLGGLLASGENPKEMFPRY